MQEADRVYTPLDVAAKCIALIPCVPNELWLDPFKGEGAFYNQYPHVAEKEWDEIREGRDFFAREVASVDWIVTNPPYSEFDKTLQKSCAVCRKGFAYVVELNKLRPRRIAMCTAKGFRVVSIYVFEINGGGWVSRPQAFVVWKKDSPISVWPAEPFRFPLTKPKSERAAKLFPRDAIDICVKCIPVRDGETLKAFGFGTERPDAEGNRTGAHWLLENTIGRGMKVPRIIQICEEQAGPQLRGFGIIMHAASAHARCLVRERFCVTSLLPFEDGDSGGWLCFFVLFMRTDEATPLFGFRPEVFTVATPVTRKRRQ